MATIDEKIAAWGNHHVARNLYFEVEYPDGWRYYHTAWGSEEHNGKIWHGVNDPAGSAVVAISDIPQEEYGQAPYCVITIAAATRGFIREYYMNRDAFEGAGINIYDRVVDQETQYENLPLDRIFSGHLTAGEIQRTSNKHRSLTVKAVSRFEGLRFPSTLYEWSPAGARKRNAGDKGQDFINAELIEIWK